jgi:hypothetical protein
MWAIAANIEMADGDYRFSRQLPTFYLHENVQGILTQEHAVKVARNLISLANPALIHNVNLWITAEKV